MPSDPTVDEVRELLKRAEKIADVLRDEWRHGYVPLSEKELGAVAALCRHFLASPMTAGEFAAELIAVCECQCLDWEALVNNAPAHEAVLRATRNARLSEWSDMKLTIESLARDHNITIVESKKS